MFLRLNKQKYFDKDREEKKTDLRGFRLWKPYSSGVRSSGINVVSVGHWFRCFGLMLQGPNRPCSKIKCMTNMLSRNVGCLSLIGAVTYPRTTEISKIKFL